MRGAEGLDEHGGRTGANVVMVLNRKAFDLQELLRLCITQEVDLAPFNIAFEQSDLARTDFLHQVEEADGLNGVRILGGIACDRVRR